MAAAITLTPSTQQAGSAVTVAGTGFPASVPVAITLDGSSAGMPTGVTTDGTGAFSTSVTLPSSLSAGTHPIAASATATASANETVTAAPAPPTLSTPLRLRIMEHSPSTVRIEWDVLDANATAIEIWRATGVGGTSALIATLVAPADEYPDHDLSAGTVYRYKIRATTTNPSYQNSAFTAEVSDTTPSAASSAVPVLVPVPTRPFSPFSEFNLRLRPNEPLDSANDTYSATLAADLVASGNPPWTLGGGTGNNYGVPHYVATGSEQLVKVVAGVPAWWSDLKETTGDPAALTTPSLTHFPIDPTWAASGLPDNHMNVEYLRFLYEFWHMVKNSSTQWTADVATRFALDGLGYRTNTAEGTTARAYGGSNWAGLITYDDVAAGDIWHALVMAGQHARHGHFAYGAAAGGRWMIATQAGGAVNDSSDIATNYPLGARFYLDMTVAEVNATAWNSIAKMVGRALSKERFGAYVVDGAGACEFFCEVPTGGRAWSTLGLTQTSLSGTLPTTAASYKWLLLPTLSVAPVG